MASSSSSAPPSQETPRPLRRVGSSPPRQEAAAGCASGIAGTLLGYPLDGVKNRMHRAKGSVSAADVVRHMVKHEGIRGTFRGIASPLLSLTVLNSLTFPVYGTWRRKVDSLTDGNPETRGGWRTFVAGTLVGPVTAAVSTPFEMVKIQSQLAGAPQSRVLLSAGSKAAALAAVGNTPQPFQLSAAGIECASHVLVSGPPRSALETFKAIVQRAGPRALWTGYAVNAARESAFFCAYFGTYEHVKPVVRENVPRPLATPIAGALSGASAWLAAVPMDFLKTRVQSQSLHVIAARPAPGIQPWSGGALAKARKLYRSGGIGALYVGTGPTIGRALLVSATRFTAYELVAEAMHEREERRAAAA